MTLTWPVVYTRRWSPPWALRTFGAGIGYLLIAATALSVGLGHDALIFDRTGDQVRAGISPYFGYARDASFYYAPPWAVLFAVTSWLPTPVFSAVISGLEVLALRYVAGSWTNAGLLGLLPLTGLEVVSGNVNLILAAAIRAALEGDGRLAAIFAFAKISPALVISDLRRSLAVAVVAVAVTLPVAGLWPDWGRSLIAAAALPPMLPIPYVVRLAIAGGLLILAWRSPRIRGLAAIVAIPNLYAYSAVIPLFALIRRVDR